MDVVEPFFRHALLEPLTVLSQKLLAMLPNLFAMGVIFVTALFLAWMGEQATERIFRMLRIDLLSQRIGLTTALVRGGVKTSPSFLAGRIVFWIVLALGIMASLAVMNLEPINKFTESLLAYLPYFLTSLIIIIGGFLVSNFVSQAVLIAAVNAGLPPARILAAGTRWGIQVAAIAMALEQLGIAETIVVVGFGITFGGIVLAMALAFGLGAQSLAKEFLEQRFSSKGKQDSSDDLRHL